MKQPTIKPFGEQAVLIEWKPAIDDKILDNVLKANQLIQQSFKEEVIETVSAYSSIAVFFKKGIKQNDFIEQLTKKLKKAPKIETSLSRILHIPVCYDSKFALDIETVAKKNELSVKEVIAMHTEQQYKVYFLGFLPGFPYLGGLNKQLHTPRKDTPREKIEAGSVAIGGSQTGVYTTYSPGGWNIIGKSPLSFFSIKNNPPALIQPGDIVQFKQVSKDLFLQIEVEVAAGVYKIEEEVIDD